MNISSPRPWVPAFAGMTMLFRVTILLLSALPALAVEPDEILQDPVLETRARALSGNLRCLVCQNQSIDDSDAALARDLRLLIRQRLLKGETDGDIVDFVTGRYGDFVLLKPRFDGATLLLWLCPFALLGVGATALWRRRARKEYASEEPLSAEEQTALTGILREEDATLPKFHVSER